MLLESTDYQILESFAIYDFKKSYNGKYINLYLETPLGKRHLVEQLFEDTQETEMKNVWEEAKEEAKEDEEDGLLPGIGRIFSLVNFFQKLKQNKFIMLPVGFVVGKVYYVYKSRAEEQTKQYDKKIENITERLFQKKYNKKYNPASSEARNEFVKLKNVVRYRVYEKENKINDIKKLKLTGNIFQRFKARISEFFLKMKSGRYGTYIVDQIEKLIVQAKTHPWLSALILGLILVLILLTIFNWAKVKKILKFIVKILTAPFRFLLKGLKWIFSLFSRNKNKENIEQK